MTVWTRPEAVYGTDRVFERLVSDKLRELGWTCEVLRTADEFGVDMICSHRGDKILVQCAPGAAVDIGDLQRAAALKAYHSADEALIVHNGSPSGRAASLADEMDVSLVHTDALGTAGAYDRSDYGVRLRLEREMALAKEERARQETADRLALMAYYEAVNKYEQDEKAWRATQRRQPWLKGMSVASIAPPFLLLGTPYFIYFLGLALAVAAYAMFFMKTGAAPVPPAPLTDLTPKDILPEWAAKSFEPRPTPKERISGVPAPATLGRATMRPKPLAEAKSIVKCPKCHTKMRLPRGRRLWASCPSCKNKFRADT
ncbi:MAG: restriction endonuclease [Sphingomonadales bacterium]